MSLFHLVQHHLPPVEKEPFPPLVGTEYQVQWYFVQPGFMIISLRSILAMMHAILKNHFLSSALNFIRSTTQNSSLDKKLALRMKPPSFADKKRKLLVGEICIAVEIQRRKLSDTSRVQWLPRTLKWEKLARGLVSIGAWGKTRECSIGRVRNNEKIRTGKKSWWFFWGNVELFC